ncbi:phytanoyl-CoA dioxygenase family protein [Nocardia sp. NBC_00565]|uniref:phytanoyl-CoA dioxygenase family protein n=1 Tax=Nocardia sp. NBC_00565 TaxID=2975993 RepID=UPI002E823534|nr:phytanoyl-CoA dioxygenase family protein [Nocardia sp. NBC_00565]WUC03850.1 phytanoyl-CoA dioxygenase family protein [Nocardia sp. NBC_00565]
MDREHAPHADDIITELDDLRVDLAGRHRATASAGATVDSTVVDADMNALDRDGYAILPNLITPEECERIRVATTALLGRTGRNTFEGKRTQRVYSLLEKTRACDRLLDHPRVLALLDRLFFPNYLLSQLQVINILPGEQAQLLHHDDGFYPIPRPRPPLSAATMWAIDPFTDINGGTVILPGSHQWDSARQPAESDARVVTQMPAGSCVFYLGTLWHGGGANDTTTPRLAVTAQYCEPWLRPQEPYTLSTSRNTARTVSEDIRRMLGYSIHPPFMGAVDGMHPKRLLETPDSADHVRSTSSPQRDTDVRHR